MPNFVSWFEIYVDDMDRAKAFYSAVLNNTFEQLVSADEGGVEMWSFGEGDFSQYGSSGALAKMEGMKPGGNSIVLYFECEDCAVEESRVNEAGGAVIFGKKSIEPWGHISICRDTEGNMFGLHSMK